MIAGHFQIPEVLVVFYDKLLRGNRVWKILYDFKDTKGQFHEPWLIWLTEIQSLG